MEEEGGTPAPMSPGHAVAIVVVDLVLDVDAEGGGGPVGGARAPAELLGDGDVLRFHFASKRERKTCGERIEGQNI